MTAISRAKIRLGGLVLTLLIIAGSQLANAAPWVTAHYVYWEENVLSPDKIDMTPITHLIYFSALPVANGTLDTSTLDEPAAVATAAHNAGKQVLVCVGGGEDSIYTAFSSAIKPANRATFVTNIVNWVSANNYDGVDLDMEPINDSDAANFSAFAQALKTALVAYRATAVLTADIAVEGSAPASAFLPALSSFDQINLETYDLSGPYEGWVTWHDSNIFANNQTFPQSSGGGPLPCSDQYIQQWITAGVPAAKLGVGVDCQGLDWTGATGPEQSIAGVTCNYRDYNDIITNSYTSAGYHYDTAAKASYLSLANDFISYTDPTLCADKVAYANSQGLGGLMVWQIEAQAMPNGDQPLLAAIATALGESSTQTGSIAIQQPAGSSLPGGSTVNLGSTTVGGSNQLSFTIVNTGATQLTNIAVAVTGSNAAQFVASAPAVTTLSSSTSTLFTVTFTPSAVGVAHASLTVSATGLASAVSIGLTGAGADFSSDFGTFSGLFGASNSITLTVDATGKFSATIYIGGAKSTFRGNFDSSLSYSATTPKGVPVNLHLGLQNNGMNPGDAVLSGSVGGAGGQAWHAAYLTGQTPSETGTYTILLTATDTAQSIPQGTGYATMSIGKSGVVKMTGKAADGAAFTSGGVLVGGTAGNQFLVFDSQLYDKKGLLAGAITFEHLADSDCDGSIQWTRPAGPGALYPAGFDTSLDLAGSLYVKPAKGVVLPILVNSTITLTGGGLLSSIAQSVSTSSQGAIAVSVPNPEKLKVHVNTTTGAMSGSFVDPVSKKSVSYSGLLYLNANLPGAGGFFIGPKIGGISLSGDITLAK